MGWEYWKEKKNKMASTSVREQNEEQHIWMPIFSLLAMWHQHLQIYGVGEMPISRQTS